MDRRDFIINSGIMITGIASTQNVTASSTLVQHERSVFKIMNAKAAQMGGMTLKNVIHGNYQNYVSPFFLFDEFGPVNLQAGTPFRVDAHPHAGIIPTTYILEGDTHHRDSLGNDFQYEQGDFIQFTSGKGALHMEETGDKLYRNGGRFHGIQSWINIPSKLKKSEPTASLTKKEDIGIVNLEGATIRVILGEVLGVKSATKLLIPVIYWHISMNEGSSLKLPVDPKQNAFIYLIKGQLEVRDKQYVTSGQSVLYERDGDFISIKANQKSELLILGGEVNNESYVTNGPFVLNNESEIRQAYFDFQQGKFGDLVQTNGIRRT